MRRLMTLMVVGSSPALCTCLGWDAWRHPLGLVSNQRFLNFPAINLCTHQIPMVINHVLLVFESEYLGIKAVALLLGKSLLIKMSRKTIIGQEGFTYAGTTTTPDYLITVHHLLNVLN